MSNALCGFLFIGDPHLQGRAPEFRSDDYPNAILGKICWCLEFCNENGLLPVLLGDLFHKPRDNPTWMLARLIEIFRQREVICIYGNHDCAEPSLTDHDSLTLLLKSGCLRMVSEDNPWFGKVAGRQVVIGGSSYRQRIPQRFKPREENPNELFPKSFFGVWLTHHDIEIPGYLSGRIAPFEIDGIDIVVNGHIHTRAEAPIQTGTTAWFNPGNISRRTRSEKSKNQPPSALRIDLHQAGYDYAYIEIPHADFEEVFHSPVTGESVSEAGSAFVAGLSELQQRRTQSGAGLNQFLEQNLDQFPQVVANEIRKLASEVTGEPFPSRSHS